ncbi:RTA1-domain-containing protein [Bimuria novae-zelandiae CBS 107.79]|uniref:RTA1-domain-containing protein n=1 Tax=Bimuria novae-zelandiae CBS 107.79 TaxID=1447943 RepID=A0A6A5V4K8_9PLEO|nr:RTA1-domain-containing protein [Bimuria novae-zelandiae CBS 107.79]
MISILHTRASERPAPLKECTEIGPGCPVEATLYGYYPSLGWNAFFVGFFGLCCVFNLGFGIRYRTWTYMIALCLGCGAEAAGYAGRVMMHSNPYDDIGFQIQICLLIISPAFISAGIYLTLKYFTLTFGESWSRLRPAWYTYIFITGDFISLVLQGAGGGLAASGDSGSSMQDLGTNLMIAGVIFQVVILTVFGYLLAEYTLRTYRRRDKLSVAATEILRSKKFRLFVAGVMTAYLAIFTRCVYRIPELTGGWGNPLMRNEPEFIALEGVMITIAALTLTVFHPGICFPVLGVKQAAKYKSINRKDNDESSVEMLPQENTAY